jgi:hypothetical protein
MLTAEWRQNHTSNDTQKLTAHFSCSDSFVADSVYFMHNSLCFDQLPNWLDIMPETVRWAVLYAEVKMNYESEEATG